jgi:WD40 repeat protein
VSAPPGIIAGLMMLAAACASMESTPIQAYIWELGHNCEHVNSAWQLDRVDSQGRYWIKGANATSAQDFQACMREQARLHPYPEWLEAGQKAVGQASPPEPPDEPQADRAAEPPLVDSPSAGPVEAATEPPADTLLEIDAGMHTAYIRRIASDAAGRYVVTGSRDKTVRLWDMESRRLVRVLRPPVGAGYEGRIDAVSISPDGATIAGGGFTAYERDGTTSIYLFDRATGRLTRRLAGVRSVTLHLAWSPDGAYLATAGHGVRVFRVRDGTLVGVDTAYQGDSHGVDFHGTGRLVSTSFDGAIRLYRVSESGLTLVDKQPAPGSKKPYTARFSPDGGAIAVGYLDSPRVDVLSGDRLHHLYSADTTGVSADRNLRTVSWSADGRQLYAGGSHRLRETRMIRVWADAGRGAFKDLPAAQDTIFDIAPLRTGGIVYGAGDPLLGVFDAGGRKVFAQGAVTADFIGNWAGFKVSPDGAVVLFGFERFGKSPASFDLKDGRLARGPAPDARLAAPLASGPGLDIEGVRGTRPPTLNGRPLALGGDASRAVAVAPDGESFVLGSEWYLRRFDRGGKVLWRVPVPSNALSVNIPADGKLVVAQIGDGTIRWYRLADGVELLALFPHRDRNRWVLWSPSGYYDASPGGEDLIGWHVNRGKDNAADFYPASRFRAVFYRPDVVARVLESGDEATALRLADAAAGRVTRPVEVMRALPPVVEIITPADGAAVGAAMVRVQFSVRSAPDAPVTGVRARVNGQAVTLPGAGLGGGEATPGAPRTVSIPISSEDSEIALFAENRHGVSVPALLHVKWRAATSGAPTGAAGGDFAVQPKLYVLAIGVSRYRDPAWRLQYAAKDARDFAQAMLAQRAGLYREVLVKVLTDAQATRDEVVDGLDWLQREVTAKDVAMVFLAGHGVNDAVGNYYYLPVNAETDSLKRTGVPFSDIRNTLTALAGKVLFFVDTCHAGNVMGTRRAGPPDITAVVNELASAENGVVVFASSTGRQYSLESSEWNNGAFTKALVDGVGGKADLQKTGRITHKMLAFYVSERVKELTRGAQTPVNPSPQGVPDFPIALTPAPGERAQ